MGLIICPDCGKEVSDQAPSCIHCGRPLNLGNQPLTANDLRTIAAEETAQQIAIENEWQKRHKKARLKAILFGVILGAIGFLTLFLIDIRMIDDWVTAPPIVLGINFFILWFFGSIINRRGKVTIFFSRVVWFCIGTLVGEGIGYGLAFLYCLAFHPELI